MSKKVNSLLRKLCFFYVSYVKFKLYRTVVEVLKQNRYNSIIKTIFILLGGVRWKPKV